MVQHSVQAAAKKVALDAKKARAAAKKAWKAEEKSQHAARWKQMTDDYKAEHAAWKASGSPRGKAPKRPACPKRASTPDQFKDPTSEDIGEEMVGGCEVVLDAQVAAGDDCDDREWTDDERDNM